MEIGEDWTRLHCDCRRCGARQLSGVVDHLPAYRAAIDDVLAAVEPMFAVEGPGGYLRPETLRSIASRHGLVCSEQWDCLLTYLFAEGHLYPHGGRLIGPSAGPSSYAWRVRSLRRAPFDLGAPYPLPWQAVKVRHDRDRARTFICCFRKGKLALKGRKRRARAATA